MSPFRLLWTAAFACRSGRHIFSLIARLNLVHSRLRGDRNTDGVGSASKQRPRHYATLDSVADFSPDRCTMQQLSRFPAWSVQFRPNERLADIGFYHPHRRHLCGHHRSLLQLSQMALLPDGHRVRFTTCCVLECGEFNMNVCSDTLDFGRDIGATAVLGFGIIYGRYAA